MHGTSSLLLRRPLWVAAVLSCTIGIGEIAGPLPAQQLGAQASAQEGSDADAESYPGGPFALVDHDGRNVTERDFRGAFVLMTFGYTFCPDVCPLTLQVVAEALDQLGDLSEQVRPLFVTVDPERDTLKVLASYVSAFHPRILGLTGTSEQIEQVAEAHFIEYERVDMDGTYFMDHSALTHLFGPDGAYLTSFFFGFAPEELVDEIRDRMIERSSGAH